MIIYNICEQDIVRAKAEQFRHIGLTLSEYEKVNDILESAVMTKHSEHNLNIKNL
jgi:hypothetical protein